MVGEEAAVAVVVVAVVRGARRMVTVRRNKSSLSYSLLWFGTIIVLE